MIVFLISSSYIENTLITNLDYLIGMNISEIVLLKENHSETEYANLNKLKIVLFDSVENAVLYSDMTIIIKPYNSDNGNYESIALNLQKNDKVCYYFDLDKLDNNSCGQNNCFQESAVPIILLISVGQFNQIQNIEFSLNRIFNNNNVQFHQVFSEASTELINYLKKNNLFNQKIDNQNCCSSYDVEIRTINTDNIEKAINDINLIDSIYKISPDFVILICESNVREFPNIIEFLQCRLNKKFDITIYSDYIPISWDDSYYPVLITNNFDTYLNKNETANYIWQSIIDRIALPENVLIMGTSK